MKLLLNIVLTALIVLVSNSITAAQFGASAEVQRPTASRNQHDLTASATTEQVSQDAGDSVADTLAKVPGTHIERKAAGGQHSFVSVRGTSASHVDVRVGALILSSADGGPVDLGMLPAAAFESVTVFRGGAPLLLSSGSMGGVVLLRPREQSNPGFSVRVMGGNFGTGGASGSAGFQSGRTQLFSQVGFRYSRSDYTFLDDKGTRLFPDDDVEQQRQNAQWFIASASLLLRHRFKAGQELSVLALGSSRLAGLPGGGAVSTESAKESRVRGLVSSSLRIPIGQHSMDLSAGWSFGRDRISDRLAEIGIGRRATDDRLGRGHLQASTTFAVTKWLSTNALLRSDYERRAPFDVYRQSEDTSNRLILNGGVEMVADLKVKRTKVVARASAKISHSRASLSGARIGDPNQRHQRNDTLPQFRASVAVAPLHYLTLTGSVQNGMRLPSMLEVFGNRAALLPNPDLRAERGTQGDLGVVLTGDKNGFYGTSELRAFTGFTTDTIRYRSTAQRTAIAENIDGAHYSGVEAGAAMRYGVLFADSSLGFVQTKDISGNELPQKPRLRVSAEVGVNVTTPSAVDRFVIKLGLNHRGDFFADPANYIQMPARTWISAGVDVSLLERWSLGLQLKDLFDQRGSDVLGFPLPGRSVFASISYRSN